MLANPSAPEIAERIFMRPGAAETRDDAIQSLTDAYDRLAGVMAVVLGDTGFRAMFARSLQKAKAAQRCVDGVILTDATASLEPLLVCLRQENPATIKAVSVALMTHFIELLSTLIGSDLTLKLLQRAWPEAIVRPFESPSENQ